MKKLISEFIGTYALVFAGTGAIVVNTITSGAVSHLGIALTFGLVVMVMIYAMGDVSGAHFNPAVTLGFWIAKRFPGNKVLPYILSQSLGALLASLTIKFLFFSPSTLGETMPIGAVSQSFVLEIILTFFLMYVILAVSSGAKEKGVTAGIVIGAVVALDALFGGPISGASMNPARSLGPAFISGNIQFLWIYMIAPVVGAWMAVIACRCSQNNNCCT